MVKLNALNGKHGGKIKMMFKSRKSSFDVDEASNVISGVMFVAILLAVLLLVISIIFGLSVFADNGVNVTTIQSNIVSMVTNFFALMPTVGTILAVVVLIAGIVLLVMYVRRMKDTGTANTYAG